MASIGNEPDGASGENSDDSNVEYSSAESALAEFNALRAEVLARMTIQQNVLSLQLGASGAVISFALAAGGRNLFLLVLPFTSYVLSGRFARNNVFVANIGIYVREQLSPRIPGGLGWEDWRLRQYRSTRFARYLDPLHITFDGPAALALIIVSPNIFIDYGIRPVQQIALTLLWTVGAVFTIATFRLTSTFAARARDLRTARMR